jgi:hypothetical protein
VPWLDALLVLLGFAVGVYGALVGVGGGFVLVPALLLLYPSDTQTTLTATSLAVVLANSASGAAAYARLRQIDYRTGLTFAAAGVPASYAGAYAVRFVPRSAFDQAFGALLLGVAVLLVYGFARFTTTERAPLAPGRGVVVRLVRRSDGIISRYSFDVRQGFALSAAAGFIVTLFGAGGGIIQVPIMVTILRIPLDIAVATSQFMLVFMAAAGVSLHAATGHFGATELSRAAFLAVGAVVGAQVGARLSSRLSGRAVVRLLGLALAAVGIRLLLAPLL